jgi:hypothetical protein
LSLFPKSLESCFLEQLVVPVFSVHREIKERYLVDVSNAFAEIELGVFDAVASFDFDEGDAWRCVSFSTGV